MTYEIFEQGPEVFIPFIIFSLIITVVAYGAFPLLYSLLLEKNITKKKYNKLCYLINFFIMILFCIINGEVSSLAPYFLWTSIFASLGINIFKKRGFLEDTQKNNQTKASNCHTESISKSPQIPNSNEKTEISYNHNSYGNGISLHAEKMLQISYCRKCGNRVTGDSVFCNKCGTKINWN